MPKAVSSPAETIPMAEEKRDPGPAAAFVPEEQQNISSAGSSSSSSISSTSSSSSNSCSSYKAEAPTASATGLSPPSDETRVLATKQVLEPRRVQVSTQKVLTRKLVPAFTINKKTVQEQKTKPAKAEPPKQRQRSSNESLFSTIILMLGLARLGKLGVLFHIIFNSRQGNHQLMDNKETISFNFLDFENYLCLKTHASFIRPGQEIFPYDTG